MSSEILRMDQCPMSDRCELVIEAEKSQLFDLLAYHFAPAPRLPGAVAGRFAAGHLMPQPCGLCGDLAYGVAIHPCCEFWRSVIESGRPCPACSISRTASKQRAASNWRRNQDRRVGGKW